MPSSLRAVGDMQCIVIEGVDARRFAQSQFSGDVDALVPGHWQWNAWLTPKGRVRALMHLADPGDGTLLALLRGGDADAVRSGLARYLLRVRATLTVRDYTGYAAGPATSGTAVIGPEGAVDLGYGTRSLHLVRLPAPPDPGASAAWRLEDIRQGWPKLPPGEPEFLPPALGLEHLGAVAFEKGCYPGQEIAARLHYRGGHKVRLCHLRGSESLPIGTIKIGSGGTAAWVLDAAPAGDAFEALAAVSQNDALDVNNLLDTYNILSSFEA